MPMPKKKPEEYVLALKMAKNARKLLEERVVEFNKELEKIVNVTEDIDELQDLASDASGLTLSGTRRIYEKILRLEQLALNAKRRNGNDY